MGRLPLALVSLFLSIGFAHAQGGAMGMGAAPAAPNVDQEALIFQVPGGWSTYQNNTDAKVHIYMFPPDQAPAEWTEILQYERFMTTLDVVAAREIYDIRTQGAGCTTHSANMLRETEENGYSMAQWRYSCDAEDNTTVVSLVKTLVGNDNLHIVSKLWKHQPSEEEFQEWAVYANRIYVCDPTTGANPCTPPPRPAAQGARP